MVSACDFVVLSLSVLAIESLTEPDSPQDSDSECVTELLLVTLCETVSAWLSVVALPLVLEDMLPSAQPDMLVSATPEL